MRPATAVIRSEIRDDHRDAPREAELGKSRLDRAGDAAERRHQQMRIGQQHLEREVLGGGMALAHEEHCGFEEQELGLQLGARCEANADDRVDRLGRRAAASRPST